MIGFPLRPKAAQRRRTPGPALPVAQLQAVWQAISFLLDYPTEKTVALVPDILASVADVPAPVREGVEQVARALVERDLGELQKEYVETFDTTRRCALHLTFYTHGDTRKRGIALVQFKQAYRRGGLEINDDELPDHLCVLLEFGAAGDPSIAWTLLNDNRAGVEILRLALTNRSSTWAPLLDALSATLPNLECDQTDAIARLLAEGPPSEDVGMEPYATDPRLNPDPAADAAALEGALS